MVENDGENGSQYQGGKASVGANEVLAVEVPAVDTGAAVAAVVTKTMELVAADPVLLEEWTDFSSGRKLWISIITCGLKPTHDSITGISYELTKCLQANGTANPAIILGDYEKSDHHGFVQIIPFPLLDHLSPSLSRKIVLFPRPQCIGSGWNDDVYFSISQAPTWNDFNQRNRCDTHLMIILMVDQAQIQ